MYPINDIKFIRVYKYTPIRVCLFLFPIIAKETAMQHKQEQKPYNDENLEDSFYDTESTAVKSLTACFIQL